MTEAVFTNEFEKPNYIVTFDGNGAWRPFESQTVREGLTASEPIRKPVRSYGKFIGWYLDGQPYDFSQPVYDDITLFAMYDDSDSDNTSGGSGGGGGGRGGSSGGGSRGGSSSRGNGRGSSIVPTPNANIATTPSAATNPDTTDKQQSSDSGKRAAGTEKIEKLDGESGSRRKKQTSGDKKRKRRLPKTGEASFEQTVLWKEERREETD